MAPAIVRSNPAKRSMSGVTERAIREALRSSRAGVPRPFAGRSITLRFRIKPAGMAAAGSGAPGWRKTIRSTSYRVAR
jgi:hypothetical protein